MRAKIERTWIARIATPTTVAIAMLSGAAPRAQQQTPIFRSTTDLITTEVRVTDRSGSSCPTSGWTSFELLEDGVPQKITAFVRAIGGRIINDMAPASGRSAKG